MRNEIASLVHPVLRHALNVRDRLRAGEQPNLDIEQATLKAMLLTEYEARRIGDFGGDPVAEGALEPDEVPSEEFLGIRYALVCWLDELFILHSSWSEAWNEQKLEVSMYGTNDRAWKFWEQARRAETRSGMDALEVFYLCVMLGFRGELHEKSEEVAAWIASSQARLMNNRLGKDWNAPPELEPVTHVPPLRARDRLQTLVMVGGMVLLVLIPVVVFFIVRELGQ